MILTRRSLIQLILSFLAVATVSLSCGEIGIGTATTNDATPSGSIIASATFETNSNSISGTALIYQADNGTFVARLETFSASTSSGRSVEVVDSQGNVALSTTLKSPQGNQNYTINSSTSNSFAIIRITLTGTPEPDNVLATALLQSI